MLLYNITVIIEEEIEREWLAWMQGTQIPEVMATNFFTSNRLLRVLDSPNEGVTYCMQYVADSRTGFDEFKRDHEQQFLAQLSSKFANRFVSFNTLMEFIDYQ